MTNLVTTTPSRFSVIRPELLPPMQVLQSIDTETIISTRMAQFKALWDLRDPPNAATYDVGNLEFDPIRINQELNTYFELLVRDRVNQACRAVTLANAFGGDEDAIASRYPYGVPRITIATGGTFDESDTAYRQRIWNSPNILSLNGPGQGVYESYVFWALSAPQPGGQPIKHASAWTRRATGNVYIPILNSSPNYNSNWVQPPSDQMLYTLDPQLTPVPTDDQINAVYQFITAPGFARQGLTDVINITKPKIEQTTINAKIWLFPGIDRATLMNEITSAVSDLILAINWLGADLTLLALQGAFAQVGVYNSQITSPAADVIVDTTSAVLVTSASLRYMGTAS
jgi:phage-related baseplate assembly protein